MRKALLLVSTAALALSAAQIAKADASYNDPAGDSTTAPARTTTANANDWTPDHAVMSATKDQLKALPQFKYSDYN